MCVLHLPAPQHARVNTEYGFIFEVTISIGCCECHHIQRWCRYEVYTDMGVTRSIGGDVVMALNLNDELINSLSHSFTLLACIFAK